MAFAASKAWIELGACGPDNPAVKASGAALLVSLLSEDGITWTLGDGDRYLSDTLA